MPEAKLIHYTGANSDDPMFAARLLAYTKNTRLNMTPDGLQKFLDMDEFDIAEEIKYMATTIPSSWEFADLIFAINNVSRATAQQITRSRNASFAMQSQRVTDMSEVTWDNHSGSDGKYSFSEEKFDRAMEENVGNYKVAIDHGMSLEDARDLLPIGVHCNLVAKYNLRAFVELVRARDSLRVQGPYREVARQMKEQVISVWPWAEPFFVPPQAAAIRMIEEVAQELGSHGAMYAGPAGKLAKAADLLKK